MEVISKNAENKAFESQFTKIQIENSVTQGHSGFHSLVLFNRVQNDTKLVKADQ